MIDKIKIRSGIPLPARHSHTELGAIADKMKPGDCVEVDKYRVCLLYTSPSPRDTALSRMPSSA